MRALFWRLVLFFVVIGYNVVYGFSVKNTIDRIKTDIKRSEYGFWGSVNYYGYGYSFANLPEGATLLSKNVHTVGEDIKDLLDDVYGYSLELAFYLKEYMLGLEYFGGKLGDLEVSYSERANIDVSNFIVRMGYRYKKYYGSIGYSWTYLIYASTNFSSDFNSISAKGKGFGIGKRWFLTYNFSSIETVFSFSIDAALYTEYDVSPEATSNLYDSSRRTFMVLNTIGLGAMWDRYNVGILLDIRNELISISRALSYVSGGSGLEGGVIFGSYIGIKVFYNYNSIRYNKL